MILLIFILVNIAIIAVIALVHYEVLSRLSMMLSQKTIGRYGQLLICVFSLLLAHSVSICLYAASYYLLSANGNFGYIGITAATDTAVINTFHSCLHFSAANYTALGYGDLVPHGYLGALAAMEALIGLISIAWTASFVFVRMQKHWPVANQ